MAKGKPNIGNNSFSGGYNGRNAPPEGTSEEIEFSTGNSFKDIVMWQLHQVTRFCNVEFRGGFYTNVETKDGGEKEIYVQDTRDVFGNAIFALTLLLQPRFDKQMKEDFLEYRTKLKKIETEFLEKSSVDEEVILGEAFYENDKDKIYLETYKNKRLVLNQRLYARISDLLARLQYMDVLGKSY